MRATRARWLTPASWLAALALAAGCSDSGTEPKPSGSTGITVTPRELTLVVGGTGTLQAVVHDSHGNEVRGARVFWSSADPAIAAVSPEGVVQALKTGTVKVAASSGGSSDVATVVVGQQPVTSIAVTPVSTTVTVGGSTQLTVTLTGASGETLTGRPVTWRSSNEAVLTVDANGRVAALAPGVASVTATSEGRSTSASVTVLSVAIGSVQVTPSAVALTVGQTTQLGVTVTDVNGQPARDREVRWTSSDERVASVSSSGLAIALAVGSATITATADGKSASVAVSVSPVPVGAVVVSPSPAQLLVGQSVTLGVQITDASGRIVDRAKSFSSDAPGIATVDQQGVVRGIAPGTTTVRVTSEGQVGTTTVVVSRVPVTSVTVTPPSANLLVGRTVTLTGTPRDARGGTLSDRPVSWRSSNDAVATVSQSGVVTAVGPGSAVVFATVEGQTDQASITVSPVPVASVAVSPSTGSILVGQTTSFTATVRDADGREVGDREVTWSTSDPRIALVSSNGVVTGVGAGTATITATSEGKSGSASITVAPVPVASVTVSPASNSATVGSTVQLSATVQDANGTTVADRPVSWTSSDPLVASVSSDGLVTALKAGTTTITATSEGRSGRATVSVSPVAVASVTVSPSPASVQVGSTVQLSAATKDANGNALSGRAVTWSSSNSDVASVTTTGLVTGVSAGSATITATSEGQSGSSTVAVAAVTPPPPTVSRVQVSPTSPKLKVNNGVTLSAACLDANGNTLSGFPVGWSWTGSRADVISLTATGAKAFVVGLKKGTATVTATCGGQTGTASVQVQ